MVPYQAAAFKAVLGLLAVLIALYGYFVGMAIHQVVARTAAESQALALQSQIGQLELSSLALHDAITPQSAMALGFVQPHDPAFMALVPTDTVVSLSH